MPVQAIAKAVRMSPRKVGVVAALVRNRSVQDALTILEHTPRRSAQAVKKVIESARANADHNHNYKVDTLRIVSVNVSPGPSLKRFRPIARGQAHPYEHQTAHITVVVDGEKRPAKKPAVSTKEPK
jgi:large subunit ribosomal protein L22